ncbi:bifunctional DNA-formamidopyrimidine glycosylase/DNA-(apurinic or apyrimidinic site) lyase [Tepidibacillus decaturensis]|uniref:Formamidopyrimidine-DNA glycosylase n=1 Tax=Tepidibacillus decaturensis TaxID=1413211 RepID=A0A135L3M5_9BACI|nr:bifunctional DNA-formamidopyrimidine glycosylase/DNA-(apurinic or apyrimidinic site) lyase [Tepidibacillus decaturensis]KXG43550.1 formamidopyrimidine-DNA glycosylase [Tepidibacillus decaturensis]
MPELPEMETYKRLLTEKIIGKPITNVEVNRANSINIPVVKFIEEVKGKQVIRIERSAKHLLFHLNDNKVLLLHLMLGGWMFYGTEAEKPKRTIQVRLSFGDHHLYFIGLRLGYLHLLNFEEANQVLQKLGPEPLASDFTEAKFLQHIEKKRGILKTSLVDQHFISGIGNCYSDEICFSAEIKPMRQIQDLSIDERSKLFKGIREVLQEAIAYGGYMENPLYVGDQITGQFDPRCKVYDREEEPCVRCGNPILREEVSSRKTFFCNVCQH